MEVLSIAVGGALGALSRYYLNLLVSKLLESTILGIFIVNVTGSFLLGLFVSATAANPLWQPNLRLFVTVGFLGAYTTFSTITVATVQLAEGGDLPRAVLNIAGSVAVGLTAAFLGYLLGRAV